MKFDEEFDKVEMNIEERLYETKILAFNVNGFPSNRANRHKIKQLNEMMKGNDILLALETGINDTCKPKLISDKHQIARLNYQDKRGKDQYQHNGAGTMILTRKNMDTQNGRGTFNNEKQSLHVLNIIKGEE